jgi:penicillin amidase
MNVSRIVPNQLRAAFILLWYRFGRRAYRRRERLDVRLRFGNIDILIARNSYGVPTITASSEAGVYFGQGYATAWDRLWQMDLLRRTAEGRLSEIFGRATLPLDRYHRTLRLQANANESTPLLPRNSAALLEAFAGGVNAAIADRSSFPTGLPVEFRLLDCRPEPWLARDSILITKLTALQLGMNASYKALMYELSKRLPIGQVEAIAAICDTADFVTTTNACFAGVPSRMTIGAPHEMSLMPFLQMRSVSSGSGSNGFVLAGHKTQTGYPMLANDPHLAFTLPATLHQVELHCTSSGDGFRAAGATVPGMPGIVSGHNEFVAWGVTNSQVDVQDLIVTTAQGEHFTEELRIKGEPSTLLTINATSSGPAVNELCGGDASAPTIVFAWSGHAPAADLHGMFALAKAHDWTAFKAAIRSLESISLNFLFAARDGDIGFKTVGRIPIRSGSLCHTPAPIEWLGYVPFDDLPELHNPPGGIIVTANNPIWGYDRPLLTHLWNPSYRAERIFDLLTRADPITASFLESVQRDTLNLHARTLVSPLLDLIDPGDVDAQSFFRLLRAWDFRDTEASRAATIWHQFFFNLIDRIYGDELRPYLPYFENMVSATTRLLLDAIEGRPSPWISDRVTLLRVVREAADLTIAAVGRKPDRWGSQHTLTLKHVLSAMLGPLRLLVDVPARPRDGSYVTVFLNGGYPRVNGGAIWSTVVSFSAIGVSDRSLLIPGESGDFRSRWYADQFRRSSQNGGLVTSAMFAVGVDVANDVLAAERVAT